MKLVIQIPAFNEEESIGKTIESMPKYIDGIDRIVCLVIDDGSSDNTKKIALAKGAQVVSHNGNKGLGQAFQTGINWALEHGADILVNIDADGQFSSNQIPLVIDPILKNEADFVLGNRFVGNIPVNMPKAKYYGNKMMTAFINRLTGLHLKDVSCGFRAFNREAMLRFNLFGRFTYTQESIIDLHFKDMRIKPVDVEVKYFKKRKSKMASNLMRYGANTFLIIMRTYRDYRPFQFFGQIGLFAFLLGFILDLIMVVRFAFTGSFSPYIFVILTGVYLNTMGIGFFVLGLVTDMFDRLRKNQETLIFHQKKLYYESLTNKSK